MSTGQSRNILGTYYILIIEPLIIMSIGFDTAILGIYFKLICLNHQDFGAPELQNKSLGGDSIYTSLKKELKYKTKFSADEPASCGTNCFLRQSLLQHHLHLPFFSSWPSSLSPHPHSPHPCTDFDRTQASPFFPTPKVASRRQHCWEFFLLPTKKDQVTPFQNFQSLIPY